MMGMGHAMAGLAAAMIATTGTPAAAEVLDAVYRGTLVCERLPSTRTTMREAIEVTIVGGVARYNHVVRLRDRPSEMLEKGVGVVKGQDIELQGSWKDDTRHYEAKYTGTFVRRSVQLKGTQTWTDGGKTATRNCFGAIKRPFKPFLPRMKPPAAS
jgi:hypothetical protein